MGTLAFAAILYFRPDEVIFSTHDAGVRINAAAQIATTGGIAIRDPNWPVAEATGTLDPPSGTYSYYLENGSIYPQFSGVAEIWEALGLTTIQPPGSLISGYGDPPAIFPARPLYLPAVFAMGSLLLLYLTTRMVFGVFAALTTLAGLALSYPEIYYARITMSEIPEQFFLFLALYALARFWRRGMDTFALLAGCGLGLAFLTHLDAGLVYVPAGVWLTTVIARRTWRRGHTLFATSAGIGFVQGIWHYLTFGSIYLLSNLAPIAGLALRSPFVVVGVGVLLAGWIAILLLGRIGDLDRIGASQSTRVVAAATVVILSFFAYFIRPLREPPTVIPTADETMVIVRNAGVIWVIVGRYLFPTTLLFALVGSVFAIVRRTSREVWTILFVGGLYAVFLGLNAFVSPQQPFWIRRFLPIAIPTIVLFAAVGIENVGSRATNRRFGKAISIAMAVLLVGSIASVGRPLWTIQPEYQGALSQTSTFAQTMPTNSIVLADDGVVAKWLPSPLTFLYHRDTFALVRRIHRDGHSVARDSISEGFIDDAIRDWEVAGKTVIFVTDGVTTSLDPERWGFIYLANQTFTFPQLTPEYWNPPTTTQTIDFRATAYRIVPLEQAPPPSFPFSLAIGGADYGYLVSGFQRSDGQPQATFRWTDANAVVDLPRPPGGAGRIALLLGGSRPVGVPTARLTIAVDSNPIRVIDLGTSPPDRQLDANFREIVVEPQFSSANGSSRIRLTLSVNTWRPSDFGFGDTRDLGVAIARIRVESP